MASKTVTKPAWAALSALSNADQCVEKAASFNKGGGITEMGRWSDPGSMVFYFRRADGSTEAFSGAQLMRCAWWYWLREDIVNSIESHLFPLPDVERPVHIIVRTEKHKLVRGGALTGFFYGDEGKLAAEQELHRQRATCPDCSVFSFESEQMAQRFLTKVSEGNEWMDIYMERRAIERKDRLQRFIETVEAEAMATCAEVING